MALHTHDETTFLFHDSNGVITHSQSASCQEEKRAKKLEKQAKKLEKKAGMSSRCDVCCEFPVS